MKHEKMLNSQPLKSPEPMQEASVPVPTVLRFTPAAWAKLLYLRDWTDNEVGVFGVSSPKDLLLVEDLAVVGQEVSHVSTSFKDEAVSRFFDDQVDLGRRPEQFARIWCHTHPGSSATPSGADEQTFARVFGKCQWAVMFVLGRTGETYARLRFNVGPGGQVLIPVQVDYSSSAEQALAWSGEYAANVTQSLPNHEFPEPVDLFPRNDERTRAKLTEAGLRAVGADLRAVGMSAAEIADWGLAEDEIEELRRYMHEGDSYGDS